MPLEYSTIACPVYAEGAVNMLCTRLSVIVVVAVLVCQFWGRSQTRHQRLPCKYPARPEYCAL